MTVPISSKHYKRRTTSPGRSDEPGIEHAYHALAIDERRLPFAPNLWTRPAEWRGQLEQAWFPGVHSNVGGGYAPDGLANEALHWLVEKAEALGLEFDTAYLVHYLPCFNSVLNNSVTLLYRVMGPLVRSLGRHVVDGEALHQSTVDRAALASSEYQPDNVADCQRSVRLPVVTTTRIPRGSRRSRPAFLSHGLVLFFRYVANQANDYQGSWRSESRREYRRAVNVRRPSSLLFSQRGATFARCQSNRLKKPRIRPEIIHRLSGLTTPLLQPGRVMMPRAPSASGC